MAGFKIAAGDSRQILDLAGDFRFHDTVQDQRVIGDFFADSVVLTKYKIISLPNGTFAR